MLAHDQRLQRLIGGSFLERGFLNAVAGVQLFMMGRHKDKDDVARIRLARRERRSLLTAYECYFVQSFAKAQAKRPGDIAEVGVFQGCSAKLICEVKGDRTLHLFDTFEGLPEAATADGKVHALKQYACSLESVSGYLKDYPNVHFYKGLFPDTTAQVPEATFSFAHFDVDLYESTLACFKYFYPRMIPGRIMLSHDYSILAGVKQAVHEFLADKPEPLIELPSTQCLVIKL